MTFAPRNGITPGLMKPMDISFTPRHSRGSRASPCTWSPPSDWTIVGNEGPWMSRSTSPTRWPAAAREYARLTAVVDLPTPPLQLATATMWPTASTPGVTAPSPPLLLMVLSLSARLRSGDMSAGASAGPLSFTWTVTSLTHSSFDRSSMPHRSASRSPAPADAASVGNSRVSDICEPSASRSTLRTMPRDTIS